jgi:hypothetical protein
MIWKPLIKHLEEAHGNVFDVVYGKAYLFSLPYQRIKETSDAYI